MQTNISEKSVFTMEEDLARFPGIIACDKPRGTFYKGQQAFPAFTLELIRAFFKDLRGCWKHKFLKKFNLSCEEKILAYFLP